MSKTRKSKTETTSKKKPGRKPFGKERMKSGIYVRLSVKEREALEEYVEKLNANREKQGVKPIAFSTWMRELALQSSGNAHLGAAAKAEKAAKAAAML